MRRKGFTFVSIVAFTGTLAIGVALLQTDAAITAFRRAAHAQANLRARLAASSLAAALPDGRAAKAELPGAKVSATANEVTAEVHLRGKPFVVVMPR